MLSFLFYHLTISEDATTSWALGWGAGPAIRGQGDPLSQATPTQAQRRMTIQQLPF